MLYASPCLVTTARGRGNVAGEALQRIAKMPAADDDDRPKKKVAHEIGHDLALLSVDELAERIALLRDEIVRLEQAAAAKRASMTAADAFFKR
jgi:uncharacterized small protein (DUF1192 family)